MNKNDVSVPEQGLSTTNIRDLMQHAIDKGGTEAVEVVERLLGVAERVADREARMAFNRAFGAFRNEVPAIHKGSRAEIASGGGGAWGWNYASLENIQKVVDPILTNHGLFYRFSNDDTDDRHTRVTCTLCHVDGHAESSTVTIRKGASNKRMSEPQQDAGTLTTAQRKAISLALGLATSDVEVPPDERDTETLTAQEAATIRDYLDQLPDGVEGKVLAVAKVGSVEDIPRKAYPKLLKTLSEKVKEK